MRRSIVGVVVFLAAYIGSIVLYVNSGMGHPHRIANGPSSNGDTKVTFDIQEIESNNSVLRANITVLPGPGLLDPQTHNLREDLSIVATSTIAASRRTWPKGTLPDIFPVSLSVAGDVADWPFDRYESGPVSIELFSGAAQVPEQAQQTLVDRLLGWKIDVNRDHQDDAVPQYRLDVYRSSSTAAFGILILAVLITLAGLGLFVAVRTLRDERKFQPPMTTWYAAMLFAVMPLRTALPDSPPFGAWIDVTVVLWVIVVLVISLALYIYCWWTHLKPDGSPRE
jgi:uncharacterized protein DUF4436